MQLLCIIVIIAPVLKKEELTSPAVTSPSGFKSKLKYKLWLPVKMLGLVLFDHDYTFLSMLRIISQKTLLANEESDAGFYFKRNLIIFK